MLFFHFLAVVKSFTVRFLRITHELPSSRIGSRHGVGSSEFNSWLCHLVAVSLEFFSPLFVHL